MGVRSTNDSRWWSRARGLPNLTYQSWGASLGDRAERPSRILAWSRTEDGFCIGSPAVLSWGDVSWQHVGWHEIQHGEWNTELQQLQWSEVAEPGQPGRRGSIRLIEPGRMPELFRERIAATIAVERFVPVNGDRGVVVTARRDLAHDGAITWRTSLTRGLTWQTPGVRDVADRATDELQTEYDFH